MRVFQSYAVDYGKHFHDARELQGHKRLLRDASDQMFRHSKRCNIWHCYLHAGFTRLDAILRVQVALDLSGNFLHEIIWLEKPKKKQF